jgi:hypothetical protein
VPHNFATWLLSFWSFVTVVRQTCVVPISVLHNFSLVQFAQLRTQSRQRLLLTLSRADLITHAMQLNSHAMRLLSTGGRTRTDYFYLCNLPTSTQPYRPFWSMYCTDPAGQCTVAFCNFKGTAKLCTAWHCVSVTRLTRGCFLTNAHAHTAWAGQCVGSQTVTGEITKIAPVGEWHDCAHTPGLDPLKGGCGN